jgi:polyisoprenoid-binding protein YceI
MKRSFCVLASILLAGAVHAAEFNRLQPEKSSIAFTYQQMGVKMDGKFKKFAATFRFDPAKPAAATVEVDVDLAAIDAGSDEADGEVVGKTWLNTKAFPTAHFATSGIKSLGGNRYEVAGKLTIKGKTQDLVFPATFSSQGAIGAFDGSFVMHRADFTIGEGTWAKFDVVANDVLVKFHMTATSGK